MAARSLPEAELDVMVSLWEQGPQTASALRAKLAKSRPMTHASVSTLLARLMDKGCVTREKGSTGKAFVFRAAVPRGGIQRRLVSDLLDRVFSGSGVALVTTLLESRSPSPEELEELSALVDQLRKTKRGPAGAAKADDRKKRGGAK